MCLLLFSRNTIKNNNFSMYNLIVSLFVILLIEKYLFIYTAKIILWSLSTLLKRHRCICIPERNAMHISCSLYLIIWIVRQFYTISLLGNLDSNLPQFSGSVYINVYTCSLLQDCGCRIQIHGWQKTSSILDLVLFEEN